MDVSSSVLGDLSREQICDVIKLVLTGDPRNTMILNNKMGQDLKEIQQKLKAGEVPPGIKATDSVWQALSFSYQRNNQGNKCWQERHVTLVHRISLG